MSKEHDVFISYADPDQELARLLQQLFHAVGISAYYAPDGLPRSPHDWENGLTQRGLKQCDFFVPIFSRHSIDRKWVLFEAGAANALGKRVFATKTEGISLDEIKRFPCAHRLQPFSLYDRNSLKVLLEQIGKAKHGKDHGKYDQFLGEVDKLLSSPRSNRRANWADQLICQARKRWIFIAGNIPKTLMSPSQSAVDEFHGFVRELTLCLFQAGFHLSACPQVPFVGRVVFDTAEGLITNNRFCGPNGCEVDYEIAGLYPIDEQSRIETTIPNGGWKDEWKKHLMKFRRSYLENKDWLVIIGGNAGTMDEFQAVKDINEGRNHSIKTCVVSHFGGTGKALIEDAFFHKHPRACFDGCKGWSPQDGIEKLAKLVAGLIKDH